MNSIWAKIKKDEEEARKTGKIRNDYWLVGNNILDANADDLRKADKVEYERWMEHKGEAINHVVSQFTDKIETLAREVGVTEDDEHEFDSFGSDPSLSFDRIEAIINKLKQKMPEAQIKAFIMSKLGVNELAYEVLTLQGDAKDYVIRYDNWILIRQNNVELYGYDMQKQKVLDRGLEVIKGRERIAVSEKDLHLAIHDFKTGRSWYATEEDILHPTVLARPQQNPATTYNFSTFHLTNPKDTEENKYSNPQKSKVGISNWRGTSECNMSFREFVEFSPAAGNLFVVI